MTCIISYPGTKLRPLHFDNIVDAEREIRLMDKAGIKITIAWKQR